jgi:hypothetical protein
MSIRQEIKALPRTTQDYRNFGWVVGGVFTALGALAWYRDASWGTWVLGLGAALVVLGTIVPKLLEPLYLAWMSMAVLMGFVMTRVILTLFFFLALLPVGLIMRLIGRDALHRKIDRNAETYWIPKEYLITGRTRLEKYF